MLTDHPFYLVKAIHKVYQAQVAIVGSRKPSPHGKQVAYDFAYYLAEKGFYICSGLAEGIDAAAHQGGLKYQRTIAVMGTGLDLTYPSQHQPCVRNIENNGCIITEFLPHTPPLQHNFPRRNRIVSALSLGVVVAEATLKVALLVQPNLLLNKARRFLRFPVIFTANTIKAVIN
jgi:DNA processing protein